jgi:hypothetical protein
VKDVMNIKQQAKIFVLYSAFLVQLIPLCANPNQQDNATLSAENIEACGKCLIAKKILEKMHADLKEHAPLRTAAALKYAIRHFKKQEKYEKNFPLSKNIRIRLEQELAGVVAREGNIAPSEKVNEEYPSGYYKDATGCHKANPNPYPLSFLVDELEGLCIVKHEIHESHTKALGGIIEKTWQEKKCIRTAAVLESAIQKCKELERNENGFDSLKDLSKYKKMREQLEKELPELQEKEAQAKNNHEKEIATAAARHEEHRKEFERWHQAWIE